MSNPNYNQQAIEALEKTGVTFKAEFLRNGKHFPEDTDNRDIYMITLERNGRVKTFEFGQSLIHSGGWICYPPKGKTLVNDKKVVARYRIAGWDTQRNEDFKVPTPYDLPRTFEDFCSDYGYDPDSRKAEETYKNVLVEWGKVQALWSEEELELLREVS